MFKKFLSSLVFLALPCATMAATIGIETAPGWEQYRSTQGICADTVTRGGDLTGMQVTASYVDGTTETVTWGRTRGGGQSAGNGFNLFLSWSNFALSVIKPIASLSLDAGTGNAVFDTSRSRVAGEDTYGTKVGFPFSVAGSHDPEGDINVDYSHSFFVAGHQRGTDAFTRMSVDFTGLVGGGLFGDLEFRTDLDSLEVAGDLTAVPLPASMLMFMTAFGLLGAGVLRKRASS